MYKRVESFSLGMPWEDSHGYVQALRVGSDVHVSGQMPHDEQGNIVGAGDLAAQAESVFANLDRVLDAVGATKRQVAETQVLVVDLGRNLAAASEAHRTYFGGHRPASTALGVLELALPGQLLEVSAVVNLDLPR